MSEMCLRPESLLPLVADAYRDAALAGAAMREVAAALEGLREALGKCGTVFDLWEVADRLVGGAWGKPEDPAFFALESRLADCIIDARISAIRRALAQDPDEGWKLLRASYAEASGRWRNEMCQRLLDTAYDLPERLLPGLRELQDHLRYSLHESWFAAYPTYVRLSEDPDVPNSARASLGVIAGEIDLFQLARPPEALRRIQVAVNLDPESARPRAALAEYWMQQNDTGQAREILEATLSEHPDDAMACSVMGDTWEKEQNYEAAAEWYQESMRRDPGNTSGLIRLCRLYGKKYDFAGGEDPVPDLVARALRLSPNEGSFLAREAAQAYRDRKEMEKAHDWCRKAIAAGPSFPAPYLLEGYLFKDEGEMDKARACFEKVIEVAGYSHEGYLAQARLAEDLGDWAEAARGFEETKKRREDWAPILTAKLAQMAWKQGVRAEAQQRGLEAVRAEPQNEQLLIIVEELTEEAGASGSHLESTRDWLARIREAAGDAYEARYRNRLAELARGAGLPLAAARDFRLAIAADPKNPLYYSGLARLYLEQKEWQYGQELWDSASPEARRDKTFRSWMSALQNGEANELYDKERYSEAIAHYEAAIVYEPDDAVLHSNLASAWERNYEAGAQRLERAAQAIRQAIRYKPKPEYSARLERYESTLAFGSSVMRLVVTLDPIIVDVASDLVSQVEHNGGLAADVQQMINEMRADILEQFGVKIPGIRFRGEQRKMEAGSYVISLQGYPAVAGQLNLSSPGAALIPPDQLPGQAARPLAGLMRHLRHVLEVNLAEFVGLDDLRLGVEDQCPELYQPLFSEPGVAAGFLRLVQALLMERLPVVELKAISERYLEMRSAGTPAVEMAERLRGLPKILESIRGYGEGRLVTLGPRLRALVDTGLRRELPIPFLGLSVERAHEALTALKNRTAGEPTVAALIVPEPGSRPFVARFFAAAVPGLQVLSAAEAGSDATVEMAEVEVGE